MSDASEAPPQQLRLPKPVVTAVAATARFSHDVRKAVQSVSTELCQSTLARLGALTLLFPLDAAKSRLQFTAAKSAGAVTAARRGPWFAGLLPTLLGHLPNGAAAFGVFTVLHARLRARHPDTPVHVTAVAAAVAADATTALWLAPAETLKIRVQTGLARNAAAAVAVGATLTGYANAVVAQVARDAPFRALHVVMYERARAELLRRGGADGAPAKELSPQQTVAVGAGVGAVAAAVTTPLDVVRTRLMSQRPGTARLYGHWPGCVARLVRTEGVGSLFRGLAPRTVYMAASVALFSLGYEASRNVVTSDKLQVRRKVEALLQGRLAQ